jgi:hypothetical protein
MNIKGFQVIGNMQYCKMIQLGLQSRSKQVMRNFIHKVQNYIRNKIEEANKFQNNIIK